MYMDGLSKPNKALAQHYLVDERIAHTMVKNVGDLYNVTVLEIGPGTGVLTRAILKLTNSQNVICIEKDEKHRAILAQLEEQYGGRLTVKYGDALDMTIFDSELKACKDRIAKVVVIANLPYNIGTILLMKWLDLIYQQRLYAQHGKKGFVENLQIMGVTVMLQHELIERVLAKPKSKNYCWLSVLAQWLCEVDELFLVPPESFFPRPKIMSGVLSLIPRKEAPTICTKERLMAICTNGFAKRRKTLHNALAPFLQNSPQLSEYLSKQRNVRAEEVSVEEFLHMASL